MTLRLYRHRLSGHAHRAELALSLLGLPHELVDVDLAAREHKTPEFLACHPFGQLPLLDDDGHHVWDSTAILVYLASKYDADGAWLPRDAAGRAAVQGWLSVASSLIAYGPAAARVAVLFRTGADTTEAIARAHGLFKVMDGELARRPFLVGGRPTLADIAAYSYTANAPEGHVDLSPYGALRAWLARVEALPGFVQFPTSAVGLRAAA
ncbi:glutathione S-transferase [Pelomonas sp. P7]|uniref:Glutathione S-transferase n=1 Tax=Pelomonas caseinilytica TaxID=2906763 RepID=A0ABS8XDL4_9BURK|nr:glutathione S-transferase [Pelomonas sp. P7]MCE4537310.1 glutathione S-transferase [Pelomonas sp. P7]